MIHVFLTFESATLGARDLQRVVDGQLLLGMQSRSSASVVGKAGFELGSVRTV